MHTLHAETLLYQAITSFFFLFDKYKGITPKSQPVTENCVYQNEKKNRGSTVSG